jgi:non-canonical purine NTP pyrophosphatase (RdgB/HAM1 family)
MFQFKEIHFATSSKSRLLAAQEIFKSSNIQIKPLPKIYTEIQAESGKEIALATAKQASKEFRLPVIREYKSLSINSLSGIPGHYVQHFSKNIPVEEMLKVLEGKKDRSGYFILDTILALPDGRIMEFSKKINVKFSKKISGDKGNWEKIIMYENSDKTLSEELKEKHDEFWNVSLKEILKSILEKEPEQKTS